jgi:DNA-3-methyladenine glycosylase I
MIWDRDETPQRPGSLAGYLEALSRPVFLTGMSWSVVRAKWDGIRAAFHEFEPRRVAAMTEEDVERLTADSRIIRNRKKIEAVIDNAARMLALDDEYGGFDRYLASLGGFDDAVVALRHDFRFLGDSGANIFLWSVGASVPSHEDWSRAHRRAS